jgi:glutaredoxin
MASRETVLNSALAILLLILLWILWNRRSCGMEGSDDLTVANKGNIIVYGSKTCPWCVKQEAYLKGKGMDYEFVDCASGQCPEFVSGFPTLMVNGEVKNGYTEL